MEQRRILVVDDEHDLCDILLFNLRAAGYQAEACYSAEEALQKIEGGPGDGGFDLLLLDVMMPGMSGFELAARLRGGATTHHTPIIFLTARDTEDDTLQGFAVGADDYVKKPFSVREVLARVKAVLSRGQNTPDTATREDRLAYEQLVINVDSKAVTVDGTPVALTRTEYDLLVLLLRHRGQVFSRQQLLEQVWPHDVIVVERTVDVNVARLRKKLGRYGACLVSRTGFGYLFSDK